MARKLNYYLFYSSAQLYVCFTFFLLSLLCNFYVTTADNTIPVRRLSVVDIVSARRSDTALPAWATNSGDVVQSNAAARRIPQIADVQADCANPEKINIVLKLDAAFSGIVYAKGHYGKPECMFTKSNGKTSSFNITAPVEMCGSKIVDKERNLKISSVVLQIQQDPVFVESTDYARDIRCTWSLRFDQLVTLKPFTVSDAKKPDRVEFSGDELSVMMDVRLGRNPFSGSSLGNEPVSLGTEMTIVVFVKSDTVEPHSVDVVVRDCQARDVEKGTIVPLTDENGCVLQPKLITPFRIAFDVPLPGVALAAYAILQSFKFPDTPRVSLTCNVALCKESCGIECSALAGQQQQQQQPQHAKEQSPPTHNRMIDVAVPQLSASAPTQQQQQTGIAHTNSKRAKRDTLSLSTTNSTTFGQQQPATNDTGTETKSANLRQSLSSSLRASRQLIGNNFFGNHSLSTSAIPTDQNNHKKLQNGQAEFDAFHDDPNFIDLALLRAKRIIFDPTRKMHQVQVGHDIMVVADTQAEQVDRNDRMRSSLLKDRLSGAVDRSAQLLLDDEQANSLMDPALLAARATHLPNTLESPSSAEAENIRLAGLLPSGKSTDVSEMKCTTDGDSSYSHWIIIAFLLVLLMLLLAIIVVLAMFINHYRNEAREAKQKYKLYGGGGTSTPATYYVASSTPTYQVYASGCETRTQITTPAIKGPITTPHLVASSNFQALSDLPSIGTLAASAPGHAYNSSWTHTLDGEDDDDDEGRSHNDDDTGTLRQRNNNIDDTQVIDFTTHMRVHGNNATSLASRSLCRSLPSLAGAFHDQQLSLVPMIDDDFSSTAPAPSSHPLPSNSDAMSSITGGQKSSFVGTHATDSEFGGCGQLPMPPSPPLAYSQQQRSQQFEGNNMDSMTMLRSQSPAKEECRSMASCIMTNADLMSTDNRAPSVSTFRPSSTITDRNSKKT